MFKIVTQLKKFSQQANQNALNFVLQANLSQMICHALDIQKYNEANLVLRHFVQRSARLLPMFADLKVSGLHDRQDRQNYSAIANLFQHFNYDDETSKHLMNSDILERIRNCFTAIHNAEELSEDSSDKLLSHFYEEYHRLMQNWMKIELN